MKDQTDFVYCTVLVLLSASCTLVYCDRGERQNNDHGEDNSLQCPPWFVYNPTAKQCECFNSLSADGIVKCTEDGAQLRLGYCMTYENDKGTVGTQTQTRSDRKCIYRKERAARS